MNLYKHQLEAATRAVNLDHFAFFFEPGAGKSAAAIESIKRKYGNFPKTVIITPKITLRNWVNELKLWSKETDIGICTGTLASKLKTIRKNKIIIINYEALRTREVLNEIVIARPEVMVLDESHRVKNHKAMQTKAVIKAGVNCKFKLILSGTPLTNSHEDLFSQFLFLNNGNSFGTSFFAFRNKYFVNRNAGWNSARAFPRWEFNHFTAQDFREKIDYCTSFVKAADVIDLPDLVEQMIPIELSKQQKRHYDELKRDLITWVEAQPESPLLAQNALTKVLRLNEIVNGYLRITDEYIETIENPRLSACVELVKSLVPFKVIIFCIYRENYKHITEALHDEGISYVLLNEELGGPVFDNIDKFNDMNSGINVCICNTQGAIGINLKSAKYAIYYSRNFSLEQYEQSKARNFRAGSVEIHQKIVHYHLVTEGTIDEIIYKRLKEKQEMAASISEIKNILKF